MSDTVNIPIRVDYRSEGKRHQDDERILRDECEDGISMFRYVPRCLFCGTSHGDEEVCKECGKTLNIFL